MENRFIKGMEWDHDNKTPDMIQFEEETEKNAIYRGKITGQFDFWLNWSKRNKHQNNIKKTNIKKPNIRITTNENIKVIKPRTIIQVPPKSICYEKKRKGTRLHPVIEVYMLNDIEVKYNWTEGQLYINNELFGQPDTKYGRDMLIYAKQNKPQVSVDKLRKWWLYNYDVATKNNWEECAISIKNFLKTFGLIVQEV